MNQAERIIARFGTAYALSQALARLNDHAVVRTPSMIYRWTYSRNRGGTDGVIPTRMIPAIQRAARLEGIVLTQEDWYV